MKLHSDITNASKEEKNKEEKLQIVHVVIKLATVPCEAGQSP